MLRKRLIRLGVVSGALAIACAAVFHTVAVSGAPKWPMWFLFAVPVLAVAACWDFVSSLPYVRPVRLMRLIFAPTIFFMTAGPAVRFLYSHDPSVRLPNYDGGDDKAYALYLIFCYGVGIVGFGILAIGMIIKSIRERMQVA